jgi:15-cis-phytoene synthase
MAPIATADIGGSRRCPRRTNQKCLPLPRKRTSSITRVGVNRMGHKDNRCQDPRQSARSKATRIIAEGSRSFALASRILPSTERLDAQLVYAWCRYADDAIDGNPKAERASVLERLRRELAELYGDRTLESSLWEALREVLQRRQIPREHLATLLDGMQMDVEGTTYETLEELLLYCHRVAGVVGWLMVGVLGVSDESALRPAAHLGIAMQLTNICRDVADDWDDGRLYLPNEVLTRHGVNDLRLRLGRPFPRQEYRAVAEAVRELLTLADRFYATGDQGFAALSARSAFAVRTARLVYAAIGTRLERANCDVLKGRAVVPIGEKLSLLAQAGIASLLEWPERLRKPRVEVALGRVPRYPDDLLPW